MFRLLCIVLGYFIGCLQSAYFVGLAYKVDIRKHGSGNLGSTNALRVLGKKAGAITFICDISKSVIAFWLCFVFFKEEPLIAGFYGCAGAVIGHDFPFYLGFKGGKGVAVMIGMMMSIFNLPALFTYIIGIIFLFSRYVSLGSLAFSASIPFVLYFAKYPTEIVILTAILSLLCFYKHRENIKRLLSGTESKLGAKKA